MNSEIVVCKDQATDGRGMSLKMVGPHSISGDSLMQRCTSLAWTAKSGRLGAGLLWTYLGLFLFIGAWAEGSVSTSRTERARLATTVKKIFENKCAGCHTPDGPERKKYADETDLDFILNLKRLASDPDIIVRGDPKGSVLFLQVEYGSMPYSDKGEDPLPKEEIRLIEVWIAAGAPEENGEMAPLP